MSEAGYDYVAPNGVPLIPGIDNDAGSRDPSSTTVGGAVANAMANSAELESDTNGQGSHIGDLLPPDPGQVTY